VFFDAHNHLQSLRFGGRQAELLAECPDVARMVVNGCCEEDWPAVSALAEAHRQVLPSFGYHPWCIHERSYHWEAELNRMLDAHPAAVGEIGLDRWKEGLDYEGQEEVFVTQLRIAAERNLPASIHCLKAWGRILELLQEGPVPERGFLLHSYGGPTEMVQAFAQLGAYFSFPGYFLRAAKGRHREAFKSVPADRLLIETDAPDQRLPDALNAYPFTDSAGEPVNHPANLPIVYQGVAKILGTPLVALAEQVEDNFERLFGN
jgi:TatD DNase family protein